VNTRVNDIRLLLDDDPDGWNIRRPPKKDGFFGKRRSAKRLLQLKAGEIDGAYRYTQDLICGKVRFFEEHWANGEKHGKFLEFYESGALMEAGENSHGTRNGLWEQVYESGALKAEYIYSNGELDGPSQRYHENGELEEKGAWSNDEPDGPWEEYHESGVLKWKGTWSGDWTLVGLEESYYPSGRLERRCHYASQGAYKGQLHGLYEEYYNQRQTLEFWGYTGEPLKREPLKDQPSDLPLRERAMYSNGKLDGPYERYSPAGHVMDLMEKGNYSNGEKCGEWIEYVLDESRGGLYGEMGRVTYDPCPSN
jgi:antitoxin component YwqK of YwqJK toxin-antitoxin module